MKVLQTTAILFFGTIALGVVVIGGMLLAAWADRRHKPAIAIAAIFGVILALSFVLSMGMIEGTAK